MNKHHMGDLGRAKEIEVPEGITEEYLDFLDELRESAETNMLGAGPYLEREFGIDRRTAKEYLEFWIKTFDLRHSEESE